MICPICGATLRLPGEVRGESSFTCTEASCGFSSPFVFDEETYARYAVMEKRKRTAMLSFDQRAKSLLLSLGYTAEEGRGGALHNAFGRLLDEALLEIEERVTSTLDALMHLDPDAEARRRDRRLLIDFLHFLPVMRGNYPSHEWEESFGLLEARLSSLDTDYEVGMYYIEKDPDCAHRCFMRGAEKGKVLSGVEAVRMSGGSREVRLVAYADLADVSQEAAFEAIRLSDPFHSEPVEYLREYRKKTYPSLSDYEKMSFWRLSLYALLECYEPALSLRMLDASGKRKLLETGNRGSARIQEMISEFSEISAVLAEDFRAAKDEGIFDSLEKQRMADAIDLLLEYTFGIEMYYRARFSPALSSDPFFLAEARNHFRNYEAEMQKRPVGRRYLLGFPFEGFLRRARLYRRDLSHILPEMNGRGEPRLLSCSFAACEDAVENAAFPETDLAALLLPYQQERYPEERAEGKTAFLRLTVYAVLRAYAFLADLEAEKKQEGKEILRSASQLLAFLEREKDGIIENMVGPEELSSLLSLLSPLCRGYHALFSEALPSQKALTLLKGEISNAARFLEQEEDAGRRHYLGEFTVRALSFEMERLLLRLRTLGKEKKG